MNGFNYNTFGFMFGGFQIIFIFVFLLVFGVIIFAVIRGISTWNKNNHSPVLSVQALISDKRTNVSHHHNGVGADAAIHSSHAYTTYYVTFQVDSGDRMEFNVSGSEYGMLSRGDRGKLTFQGTRYLSFEREYNGNFY